MTSTYTTDSPETPDTFPLIVPALADRHIANTTIPITKKLRDMIFLPLFGNSQIEGADHPPRIFSTQTPIRQPRNSSGTDWSAWCWFLANRRSAWAGSGTQTTS